MTTMGADMSAQNITISTVEMKPGEDIVSWYNRVTKLFQGTEFQNLPSDVKKYMLYGPMDCDKKVTPPKIGSTLVQIDEPQLPRKFGHYELLEAQKFKALPEALPDQTIKADAGKPPLGMVPMEIMRNIAVIREYGNNKYKDPWSWKRVEKERYVDAMLRHALAFTDDYLSVDEESKLPHLWHLACNIAFLCDMLKEELNAIYSTPTDEHQPRR